MKTCIETKDDRSRRYYFRAEFEAGARSTVEILSAFAAFYAGDMARISMTGGKSGKGPLELGADIMPFEKFLATIGDENE